MCDKRVYASVEAGRKAHRGNRRRQGASFRLRVYFCPECRGFHVTNAEKR